MKGSSEKRVGIIGGAFDPIHFGHLRAAEEVRESLDLDRVIFVPTYHPPHKPIHTLSPFNFRVALVKKAISCVPYFECSNIEKTLSCPSYTVNTLKAMKDHLGQGVQLYFLMGTDAFLEIQTWFRYRELVDLCTIVVMQRDREGEKEIREHGEDVFGKDLGQRLHVIPVTHLAISSSQIRGLIREKRSIHFLLPEECILYMEKQGIYMTGENKEKVTVQSDFVPEGKLKTFVALVSEAHGEDIVALDLRGIASMCDYFIIAQGRSTRHVQGTCERLRESLKKKGYYALSVEGEREGKWILMDYGDVVIHLFYEPMRSFYDLEGLWHKARRYYCAER